MDRRIQLGHSSRVRGPRLVQVRGCVPGVARPEGVQQGWGATAEGHGRPCSREPQGVPHRQGPARPIGLAPLHPVPVEGRLRADEPRPDGVHDPVHCREQRRGPRSVQGADGREGGLVEESPRTALEVTPCGSVRFVCLRHRVRHQAPDGRPLCSAAGPGVPRPISPSAWHGAAGSAKGGGGRGLGGEHVRQPRNGCAGPAGARASTEGQRPRGPLVRARGCVPPRCAGARPPSLCACAGLREVRARGTRLPGRTARTCWRLSTLRRTPCHILRRVSRCVGGGRAATKGRDGGAVGCPTSFGGVPRSPAGGRGRGAGSPCQASSAGPPATCSRGGSRGRGRRR